MIQRIRGAIDYWFDIANYEDKFGFYQIAAGIFLLIQPHRGVAWFIDSQVPFITGEMFGVLMIIAGVALVAVDNRLPPIQQFRLKRWPLFVWYLYIAMSFIAAIRPYPAPPFGGPEPGFNQIPGVVIVVYTFVGDILFSQLSRLRNAAE